MTNQDLLNSLYIVLDNASSDEFDKAVALELIGSTLNMMQYEKVFGNLDDLITQATVTTDSGGEALNTLTNFGDVVYLEFEGTALEECPVSMLDLYADSDLQRVAFWTDESLVKHIKLSLPQAGELKVWYEPDVAQNPSKASTVKFRDSLKWCIVYRVAKAALPYVKYKDPLKMQNRAVLYSSIEQGADKWEIIYEELVNRIGTNRPFSRLPFMAGR